MQQKINVLQFICPAGFYGAERWVLALANNSDESLVRQDLAVTIEVNQKELEITKYGSLFSGNVHQIKTKGPFDLRAISKLCRIIRDRNINIIHTHGYKSDIIGVMAAKLMGIKSISTPHGFGDVKSRKLKLFIGLGCFSFRFFDWVVPLSEELTNEVIRRGGPKKKVKLIDNGVDLKEVDQVRHNGNLVDRSIKRIGYIGQLIPGKQVHHIVEAFAQIWKKDNSLELVVIGDGPSRKLLESQAAKTEAGVNISFLGFRADRLEKLKSFSLFTMTSSSEGIPRCLMEAMGMGVPIVAYDIQGVDKLIIDEETGLLAALNDVKALENAWSRLLYDDALTAKIQDQAMRFVQDKFSASRMASEYLALYQNMMKK